MKARIALSGTLVIEPETEIEGFALRCWGEKYGYFDAPCGKTMQAFTNIILKESVPVIVRGDE